MNQHLSKKLRQYARRDWRKFLDLFWERVAEESLWTRIQLAWRMIWIGFQHKYMSKNPSRHLQKALRKARKRAKKQGVARFPYPMPEKT